MTGMYFINTGLVKVHKHWNNDKELILRIAKNGDIVGHRGLGSDTIYPVSGTALASTDVCYVDLDFFNSTLKVNPDFLYQLMMFFASELKESEKRMRNLAHMSEQIPGGAEGPNEWGVIGISRAQWMLGAAALTLGGNFRVGLEDNFYLPNGEMARSNGDLIAKARQMVEDTGRRPATVGEARQMLGTQKMKWPPEPAAAAA